jgi:hypothetical protein
MTRFAMPDLVRAFRTGERFGDRTVRVFEADPLVLPTGHIVACDPGYLLSIHNREKPFTRAVPPGRYPVLLSLLDWPGLAKSNPNYETVACAMVGFRDVPVARWEMALRPDWDLSTLKPGYHLGYGVDGGEGCFLDEWVLRFLPDDQPAFFDAFQKAMKLQWEAYQQAQAGSPEALRASGEAIANALPRAYRTIMPPALGELFAARFEMLRPRTPAQSAVLDPLTGANLVKFQSGDGDGCYASYFGLADDGAAVCLVTDFGLLVRGVLATLELPVPVQEQSALTHPDLTNAGVDGVHVEWRPADGEVLVHLHGALYVQDVHFETRPGTRARHTAGCGGGEEGGTWWFKLDEPLQPTARVLIEYTLRREAL